MTARADPAQTGATRGRDGRPISSAGRAEGAPYRDPQLRREVRRTPTMPLRSRHYRVGVGRRPGVAAQAERLGAITARFRLRRARHLKLAEGAGLEPA